jgi:LysM repeat protein
MSWKRQRLEINLRDGRLGHAVVAVGLILSLMFPLIVGAAAIGDSSRRTGRTPTARDVQGQPILAAVPILQATPTWPSQSISDQLQSLMQQLDAAWNVQNWVEVLRLVDLIIALDPNYDNIQERRYLAYVNYGYQLITEGRCTESLAAFRRAYDLKPDRQEAQLGLELLSRYCPTPVPPTATPGPSPIYTPTPWPPTYPSPTPVCTHTAPFAYTVQPGDTLYSLAKRYCTTVQAIMHANGKLSYFLRSGEVIWIPSSGAPAPGPLVHIVQPGETLFSIAQKYNTTVWAIMAANGLQCYHIWAYRALFIPTALQPGPIVVVVMPGQTLYSIASQHNTTVALLMLANNLRTYDIYVNQRLVIPPAGWSGWPPLVPGGPVGVPPAPIPTRTYVVRPGDTLFSIAQRFGTTVGAIMSANGLSTTTIRSGMVLKIP